MGDLKTNWPNPGTPIPDLGGQGIIGRGSDPNADGGGGLAGIIGSPFDKVMPTPSGAESANSVSGLPSLPNRFEPAAANVEIPSMKDRSPLTVDKP